MTSSCRRPMVLRRMTGWGSRLNSRRRVRGRTLITPSTFVIQCFQAQKSRSSTQLFFNPQQLVVFDDAVGPRFGASLDLTRSRGHCKIGDEGVFGFAGAVRNY